MEKQRAKKSSTERVRAFRDRQRAAKPPKKPPKSPKQRSRKYRSRHRARKLFFTWDDKKIVMFLTIFESFESLWDPNNEQYEMMKNNDEMYEKLLKDLMLIGLMGKNADLDLLKALIELVKDTFDEELKNMESNKTVERSGGHYQSKLPWFEHATFLRNSIEARQLSPINATQTVQDATDVKIEIVEENGIHKEIPEFVACPDSFKTSVKLEPIVEENQPVNVPESGPCYAQEDACNFFGKYVAAELRALPIKTRMVVQQEIQSCITAAVIRNLAGSNDSKTNKVPNVLEGPSIP